jgi:hypothetical protein
MTFPLPEQQQPTVLIAEAAMTKTSLSTCETTKPTIFDLYQQVADTVGPLELELRYAELDELTSQLVDVTWTFVGALARAHGYTDADWDAAERSFRHALDEQ